LVLVFILEWSFVCSLIFFLLQMHIKEKRWNKSTYIRISKSYITQKN
jgi:hypothetical protein